MSAAAEARELPIIDFAGLDSEAGAAAIARELDETFSGIGFCYFRNIGVSDELAREPVRRIAPFPRAVGHGETCAGDERSFHRGYMAPNSSLIVTSSVAQVRRPNYSESLMIMHEVAPTTRASASRCKVRTNGRTFQASARRWKRTKTAIRRFCYRLLRPMAVALGLPPHWLVPFFTFPTTFLRLLHYPPQPPDSPDDAFGSAPHTDYGFITILCQDNAGGWKYGAAMAPG